ncbi:hypothetical protein BD414DRAFT_46132 [Trametes punicea]|nr:hypothetical protein BD414DRAFT_46132 [Trametes punicea]
MPELAADAASQNLRPESFVSSSTVPPAAVSVRAMARWTVVPNTEQLSYGSHIPRSYMDMLLCSSAEQTQAVWLTPEATLLVAMRWQDPSRFCDRLLYAELPLVGGHTVWAKYRTSRDRTSAALGPEFPMASMADGTVDTDVVLVVILAVDWRGMTVDFGTTPVRDWSSIGESLPDMPFVAPRCILVLWRGGERGCASANLPRLASLLCEILGAVKLVNGSISRETQTGESR